MCRGFKVKISLLLIILSIFYSVATKDVIAQGYDMPVDAGNVNLVLDSSKHSDMIKNFRKSSDLIKNNKDLNLYGLDSLNISGSQQFSECNLPILINKIDTSLPITIIDLRQESHGFINGYPVSWANAKNDANMGLTEEQVLLDENNRLKSIKLNQSITFFNHPDITIIPTKVNNENELIDSNLLSYIRIPVTDGKIPIDDMVDQFIDLVKSQPKDTWLHFHCKHGIGRTTTFMIMYDMIKNSKEVVADDIINRQLLLANFNDNDVKSFCDDERISFLENFYKYTKENSNDFNVKWSDWRKAVSLSSRVNSNKNLAILVDLTEERLYLIDTGKNTIIKKYGIASGKAETPSPVGTWKVVSMGKWSGGFGTRWIGLDVPWGKFGIHGTNRPGSIGSEASHGCIRMLNRDVEELYEHVNHGMIVAIYAGTNGPFEKGLVTLKPGDRGASILEVQRRMKEKGYYPGELDGIYGEGMKQYVLKFRKDNDLTVNHNIDHEFYKKLGIELVD